MASTGEKPLILFLHALGMSGGEWRDVATALVGRFDCFAPDIPGFGDAADAGALSVAEMVDWAANLVRARARERWLVVGHSMGGRIAALLAARAEAYEPGLGGYAGLVLVAGSPPTPEPMDEDRRAEMIGWAAQGAIGDANARTFVEANVATDLPPATMASAIADVRRAHPDAWIAWLDRGSREDWTINMPKLRRPALIVAGGEDGDLGPDAQRRLNAPHHADAILKVIDGVAHLIPLEAPATLAALIAGHADPALAEPDLPPRFARLLASDRVSERTRSILSDRLAEPKGPPMLGEERLTLLDAILARVLPQRGTRIDLARRIEVELAAGGSDGWRFAALPADRDAWIAGLDTLAASAPDFVTRPTEAQDAVLSAIAAGTSERGGCLSPDQMRLWFEDVRAAAVRHWLAHPAALARIGYDGFANGGDGVRKQGFHRLAAGERDAWQVEAPL